jgi:hypothetical protein
VCMFYESFSNVGVSVCGTMKMSRTDPAFGLIRDYIPFRAAISSASTSLLENNPTFSKQPSSLYR